MPRECECGCTFPPKCDPLPEPAIISRLDVDVDDDNDECELEYTEAAVGVAVAEECADNVVAAEYPFFEDDCW